MTRLFNLLLIIGAGLLILSLFWINKEFYGQFAKNSEVAEITTRLASIEGSVNKIAKDLHETNNYVGDVTGDFQKYASLGASLAIETPVAWFETSLANNILIDATSMTLNNATTRDGTELASSTYSFVIDEGKPTKELIRADCTGTVCVRLERGLSVVSGTTTVSGNRYPHRAGASVKITDAPLLLNLTRIMNGIGTYPNIISYTSHPTFTSGTNIIDKTYADGLVAAGVATSSESNFGGVWLATALQQASSTNGSPNAPYVLQSRYATSSPNGTLAALYTLILDNAGKIAQTAYDLTANFTVSGLWTHNGATAINATSTAAAGVKTVGYNIFASSTAGSTITGNTLPQPVSLSTSTNRINPADANDLLFFDNFHGFAVQSGASGANVLVQIEGIVEGFSGLKPGADYYVQDAAGTIGTSIGTYEMLVGRAISPTQVRIVRGKDEYIGSVSFTQSTAGVTSCTAYATSTPIAKKYIAADVYAQGAGGGAPGYFKASMPLSRKGATSVSGAATAGSPSTAQAVTVSISGDIVTLSASFTSGGSNGSCGGTLYMYR